MSKLLHFHCTCVLHITILLCTILRLLRCEKCVPRHLRTHNAIIRLASRENCENLIPTPTTVSKIVYVQVQCTWLFFHTKCIVIDYMVGLTVTSVNWWIGNPIFVRLNICHAQYMCMFLCIFLFKSYSWILIHGTWYISHVHTHRQMYRRWKCDHCVSPWLHQRYRKKRKKRGEHNCYGCLKLEAQTEVLGYGDAENDASFKICSLSK